MVSKHSQTLNILILLVFFVALTDGFQYLQNPDFSEHISINDISYWVFSNYKQPQIPKLLNPLAEFIDRKIVPYSQLKQVSCPIKSNYISMAGICIYQKVPVLPAGTYELSAQILIKRDQALSLYFGFSVFDQNKNDLVVRFFQLFQINQNQAVKFQMTINQEKTNVYFGICMEGVLTNVVHFTNVYLKSITRVSAPAIIDYCYFSKLIGWERFCTCCAEGYAPDITLKSCQLIHDIQYCAVDKIIGYQKECSTCIQGYSLNSDKTQCIANLLNCKDEINVGEIRKCLTCDEGYSKNSDTTACLPIPNILNCQTHQVIGETKFCLTCNQGYVLDRSNNACIPFVTFCSTYLDGKCSLCIDGYYLINNQCFEKSSKCVRKDAQGLCTECKPTYSVIDGLCSKDTPSPHCSSTQYLSADNVCVDGTVKHCTKYLSPSGQCLSCDSHYRLNPQNQCVLICPPNTVTQKYIARKGKCVLTDLNCDQINDDGSCAACEEGFYLLKNVCYSAQNKQLSVDDSVSDTSDVRTDSQGRSYVLNADGSRTYLTGPWKNMQVWVDEEGNLFAKLVNRGRKYLTGRFQNLVSYQNQNGDWRTINDKGIKVLY